MRSLGWATAALGALMLALAASAAAAPFRTAVYPADLPSAGPNLGIELSRVRAAGASVVRIAVSWPEVAPASLPSGFNSTNPADPAYRWGAVDARVEAAVAAGLQPMLDIVEAPPWAEAGGSAYLVGPLRPDAKQLGQFAAAAAARYSGRFEGLPRVRYWMLYNEPNLSSNLRPQYVGDNAASPQLYRALLDAFARAVHAADASNIVVAGALAPFGSKPTAPYLQGVAPLRFMRELLCMSAGRHPRAACSQTAAFDAFSVHPYTYGGPTHSAAAPDDVSMGDLPKVRALLGAAWKARHIRARAAPQFWVTEFSWDTSPPDAQGLPLPLAVRWTSEALYRMWSSGVSLVTWFQLRDQPTAYQSGLYFAGATVAADRPKPTLRAFRFPFVAFTGKSGTRIWGRTPASTAAVVLVQRQSGRRWTTVARVHARSGGIFTTRLRPYAPRGYLRARLADGSDVSAPFGLKPVPDHRVLPFGGN